MKKLLLLLILTSWPYFSHGTSAPVTLTALNQVPAVAAISGTDSILIVDSYGTLVNQIPFSAFSALSAAYLTGTLSSNVWAVNLLGLSATSSISGLSLALHNNAVTLSGTVIQGITAGINITTSTTGNIVTVNSIGRGSDTLTTATSTSPGLILAVSGSSVNLSGTSDYAYYADSANYSTFAYSSSIADLSGTASYADYAGTASYATGAGTAGISEKAYTDFLSFFNPYNSYAINGSTGEFLQTDGLGSFLTGTTTMSVPWSKVLSAPAFITATGTATTITGTIPNTQVSGLGTASTQATGAFDLSGTAATLFALSIPKTGGTGTGITLSGTTAISTTGTPVLLTGSNGNLFVGGTMVTIGNVPYTLAVRSATATLGVRETTIFNGSTASQTLTMPSAPAKGTNNIICNYSSVAVTLSPDGGSFNTFGNTAATNVLQPTECYSYVYDGTGVWYGINSNDLSTAYNGQSGFITATGTAARITGTITGTQVSGTVANATVSGSTTDSRLSSAIQGITAGTSITTSTSAGIVTVNSTDGGGGSMTSGTIYVSGTRLMATGDVNYMVSGSTSSVLQLSASNSLASGWFCYAKSVAATTDVATAQMSLTGTAGALVDGTTTIHLTAGECRFIVYDGANFTTTMVKPGQLKFISSSTWIVPPGISGVEIDIVDGGGGGGAGMTGSTSTLRFGGAGGGGGARLRTRISSAELVTGSNYTITVGAQTGAAATSGSGANGSIGNYSAFGTIAGGQGGGGGGGGGFAMVANLNGGSGGGTMGPGKVSSGVTAITGGLPGNFVGAGAGGGGAGASSGGTFTAEWGGASGGYVTSAGADQNGYGSLWGGSSAGGGGGALANNTDTGGRAGGSWNATVNGGGGTAGSIPGGAGGNGADGIFGHGGQGGGSGGSSAAGTGGAGGDGGAPGGAGGITGGAGGRGARGEVIIRVY